MSTYRQNAKPPPWPSNERWWFLDHLFDKYRWYRRMCGGHWERWFIESVWADLWFQQTKCGKRPPLGVAQTAPCEHYARPTPGAGNPEGRRDKP